MKNERKIYPSILARQSNFNTDVRDHILTGYLSEEMHRKLRNNNKKRDK